MYDQPQRPFTEQAYQATYTVEMCCRPLGIPDAKKEEKETDAMCL
jgi:hypothetical protein